MEQKMDSVLRILMQQFPPRPELKSTPSIRRVTIQNRKVNGDDLWCRSEGHTGNDGLVNKGGLKEKELHK